MIDKQVIIVSAIIFFIALLLFASWEYSLSRYYKNTPIIKLSGPSEKNINPPSQLMGSVQTAKELSFSGFKHSTLQQPCTNSIDDKGLANLPTSYLTNCDKTQICGSTTTKGDVCLSKVGYYCKGRLDCYSADNTANPVECVANICVSKTEKLNALCDTNDDCLAPSSMNTQNLSCVNTDDKKRCKYDIFPLSYGCTNDDECYPDSDGNEYRCVEGVGTSYNVTGTGTSSNTIKIDEGMSVYVYSLINYIDGKKVKVTAPDYGPSIFKIEDFDINDFSFSLYNLANKQETISSGYSYNIMFYPSEVQKTCIAAIPANSKISAIENDKIKQVIENNLEKACQTGSGIISLGESSYCLSNEYINNKQQKYTNRSVPGTICDTNNNFMGCCSSTTSKIQQLTCLYNEDLDETTGNNYNFVGNTDYKTVGRCLFPSGNIMSGCNNVLKGCSMPYICYNENSGSVCLQPLNTQECYFDDSCPPGFGCKDKICISEGPNNPAINSETIQDEYGIFYFDPVKNAYSKITIANENSILKILVKGDKYEDLQLVLGQNYINSNVNKICLFRARDSSLYILTHVEGDAYELKIHLMELTNTTETPQIIIDPDDNVFVVLQEKIKTVRKRSYKISQSGTSLTLETPFPNLSKGTKVFYSGTSSTINDKNIYTIDSTGISGNNIKLKDIGSYDPALEGNYIITYDNVLAYPQGTFTNDGGIGYCQDNIDGTNYSWVQTGDMFKLTGSDLGISGSIVGVGPEVVLKKGPSIYFYTEISQYDNYGYYMISDDYNASEGSTPFIENNKYIGQKIQGNDGTSVTLYDGLVSYSMIHIDETSVSSISNSDPYVQKQGGSFAKNGMDVGGVTYAFDSDTKVEFKTYKKNDQNYLLVHSKIETEVNENNIDGTENTITKNIDYVQNIKYSIGSCWDYGYDYQYQNQSSSTCWFNFSYQNNALLPHSKNYFETDGITSGGISFNNINNVYPNIFNIQEDDDLNIYSSVTNNDTTQTGSNINIVNESKFRKIESNFSGNQDPAEKMTFKGIESVFSIPPVPLEGGLVHSMSAIPGENTFIENGTILTFNNSKDIDMILKYGSSEIAIVKEIENLTLAKTDFMFINWFLKSPNNNIVSGTPSVILVITDIVSHEVNLNSERLVCVINRPVDYNVEKNYKFSETKIDNSFDTYIIDSKLTKWNFYLYNYIPLCCRFYKPSGLRSFITSIFDSSPLYTSSKLRNNDTKYSRCSYNKILTLQKENEEYRITNNFNGYGLIYKRENRSDPSNHNINLLGNQNNLNTNVIYKGSLIININPDYTLPFLVVAIMRSRMIQL